MPIITGFLLNPGNFARLPLEKRGRVPVKLNVTLTDSARWYALEHQEDPRYWASVRTDRVVILLKRGHTLNSRSVSSLLGRYGATKVVRRSMYPDVLNFYEVELPDGSREKVLNLVREARNVPEIAVVEPVVMFHRMSCPPNDTYWGYQWGPYVILADSAWCHEAGSHSVVVAVLDTGTDTDHEDLRDNYWSGYDYVDNDPDPSPDDPSTEKHGSHVSGTIAGVLNNSTGISGMANVSLFAGRVLDESGSGSLSTIANGILGASSLPQVRVINMSLGASAPSAVVEAACDTAWNRGKLLIAASGNDGSPGISYPAAYPSVVAVGSIGTDGTNFYLAPYSNYGPEQELTAPGGDASTGYCILSTLPGDSYGDFGTGCTWVGTSMATPHVSGVAALVFSHRPSLRNDQVREILISTAIDLGSSGRDQYYGYGAVCAVCAVLEAETDVREVPSGPSAVPYEIRDGELKALSPIRVYTVSGRLVADLSRGSSLSLRRGVYLIGHSGGKYRVLVF